MNRVEIDGRLWVYQLLVSGMNRLHNGGSFD